MAGWHAGSHTAYDGDLLFACATGCSGRTPDAAEAVELAAAAAAVVARAIARGVYEAQAFAGDQRPAWRDL